MDLRPTREQCGVDVQATCWTLACGMPAVSIIHEPRGSCTLSHILFSRGIHSSAAVERCYRKRHKGHQGPVIQSYNITHITHVFLVRYAALPYNSVPLNVRVGAVCFCEDLAAVVRWAQDGYTQRVIPTIIVLCDITHWSSIGELLLRTLA